MQQNRPLPRHTKAQSWHTQSELVTFLAQARRGWLETEFVVLLLELSDEHENLSVQIPTCEIVTSENGR